MTNSQLIVRNVEGSIAVRRTLRFLLRRDVRAMDQFDQLELRLGDDVLGTEVEQETLDRYQADGWEVVSEEMRPDYLAPKTQMKVTTIRRREK